MKWKLNLNRFTSSQSRVSPKTQVIIAIRSIVFHLNFKQNHIHIQPIKGSKLTSPFCVRQTVCMPPPHTCMTGSGMVTSAGRPRSIMSAPRPSCPTSPSPHTSTTPGISLWLLWCTETKQPGRLKQEISMRYFFCKSSFNTIITLFPFVPKYDYFCIFSSK